MINLSHRLKAIADHIEDNTKIIDIGCDHGLLDIYLAQKHKNIKIIASDINANALDSAKKNIQKYNLTNIIETRLGSGLEIISPDEINTIIMSGLGTHTIVGILVNNIDKLKNVSDIIIQSNTNIEFLRKKVVDLKYYIHSETLIKDRKIIYTIIHFKKGKKRYNKKEIFFGPILLKENSNLFREKNKEDLTKLEGLYKVIPKNHFHHRLTVLSRIKMYKKLSK